MNTKRPEGDKLFKQSLINVAGTGTVEEIMRDMAQIAEPKSCRTSNGPPTIMYDTNIDSASRIQIRIRI